MALTYEPIQTTTLTSTQASVTFSSISSAYTDLVLIIQAKATSGSQNTMGLQFNSDTGTNYSRTSIQGNGTSATSTRGSNESMFYFAYDAGADNTFAGNYIIHINNYSNSTTYKTALARSNNANTATQARIGLWRSTSAINSIKILGDSLTYDVGSTFTLYGIKAA